MKVDLKRFHETFFEEAAEHLATMEAGLLELETRSADAEQLNSIFRAAHSIKGGSGSFGFTEIAHFTHALENVLDRLRSGRLTVEPALTSLLLKSADLLRDLVDATRRGEPGAVAIDETVAALEAALGDARGQADPPSVGGRPAAGTGAAAAASSAAGARTAEHEVVFAPHAGFFRQGQDVLLLLRELAELGEVLEVRCDRSRLPSLEAMDPESCYLGWTWRLRAACGENGVRDVFMFVEDACDLAIRTTAGAPAEGGSPAPAGAAGAPAAGAPAGGGWGAEGGAAAERRQGGDRRADSASIRVPTEKVDALVNLVGEIIIAQAMVSQLAGSLMGEDQLRMQEALGIVERSTRELQEKVMSIRMLPIGAVFNRFPRIVRDLAQAMGKKVRLEMTGADTELDKSVIERLGDPLTHLVRNAVDHGLEPPAERVERGKPAEGVVHLRALHQGGNVVIEILDDGRGLDRDRIREKAVALGLVHPDAVLTDEQVLELLFRPGFSTAKVVTDVSGRGVGMDVVKRNVEALNGAITVSSTPGQGSRFRIRLPLTLAILDGLSVRVGRQVFIIPLLSIAESVRPQPGDVRTVLGGRGEIFLHQGQRIPLLRLDHLLAVPDTASDPCAGIVMVLESDGSQFGVLVDDVMGQSQVVIKSLERNFRKVDAVMGATILGDGHVALIVDVPELHRVATRRRADADPPLGGDPPSAGARPAGEAGVGSDGLVAAGAGSSVSVR